MSDVKIIKLRPGLFCDVAVIEALKFSETIWDSLLGERCFFISSGQRVQVKLPKDLYVEGDELRFDDVCTPNNAFNFNWVWIS